MERVRGFVKALETACGNLRASYIPVNTRHPLRHTLLRHLGGRRG